MRHLLTQGGEGTQAFTLAEVLITLGIIGIVAAMTMPTLMHRKQTKELEVSLKKNYSVIQQVLGKINYDSGLTIKPELYPAQTFYLDFAKYVNLAYSCGNTGCVGMNNEEIDGVNVANNIKNYKIFSKKLNVATYFFDDGQVILRDGTMYIFENPAGLAQLFITVDVNGYKKNPNIWGHDLFTFQITDSGKLLPMGAEGTSYIDENQYCSPVSSHQLNGIGCAYKALTVKGYWKNLP